MNDCPSLPLEAIRSINDYMQRSYSADALSHYANEYKAFCDAGNRWIVLLREEIIACTKETFEVSSLKRLDSYMGHFFEIYPYEDDYIIYGELFILRISADMEVVWEFSARDIFIQPDCNDCFKMEEDKIVLKDWLGWHYYLSYNGKLIKEFQ